MRFQLKCTACGAVCWVRGTDEPDVGGVSLNEDDEWEWTVELWIECEHEDFEIVDSEYDPPFPDDVM